jgi:hypothetical protein
MVGIRRCGSFGNFAHLFHARFHAAQVKKRGAADKTVRAGVRAIGDGLEIHSAVHTDVVIEILLVTPLVSLLDFGQRFVDEGLSPKSGVYGHDEERINLVEERLNVRNGCGWVDGETDLFSQGTNGPNQLCDAFAELDVNVHLIGAGFRKRFQENFRLGTHEMDVEEHFGQWTDGLHDGRAEGDVLDEMAVHDVEVQPVGRRSIGAPGFFFQAPEIGGEQRRRNIHVGGQYRLEHKVKSPKSELAAFRKNLDTTGISLLALACKSRHASETLI